MALEGQALLQATVHPQLPIPLEAPFIGPFNRSHDANGLFVKRAKTLQRLSELIIIQSQGESSASISCPCGASRKFHEYYDDGKHDAAHPSHTAVFSVIAHLTLPFPPAGLFFLGSSRILSADRTGLGPSSRSYASR